MLRIDSANVLSSSWFFVFVCLVVPNIQVVCGASQGEMWPLEEICGKSIQTDLSNRVALLFRLWLFLASVVAASAQTVFLRSLSYVTHTHTYQKIWEFAKNVNAGSGAGISCQPLTLRANLVVHDMYPSDWPHDILPQGTITLGGR